MPELTGGGPIGAELRVHASSRLEIFWKVLVVPELEAELFKGSEPILFHIRDFRIQIYGTARTVKGKDLNCTALVRWW